MKIGMLTGGGDCPGLNAVIRAVVKKSRQYNWEVIGIKNGWNGLITGEIQCVSDLIEAHSIVALVYQICLTLNQSSRQLF